MKQEKIEELYGLTNNSTFNSNTGQVKFGKLDHGFQSSGYTNKSSGMTRNLNLGKIKYSNAPWQDNIAINILKKRDTFVVIPPAGGKTGPVLDAWLSSFKASLGGTTKLNPSHKDFFRVLFCAPTKQLAAQLAHQDFKPKLFELITTNQDFKNLVLNTTNMHGSTGNNTPLTAKELPVIYDFIRDICDDIVGSDDKNSHKLRSKNFGNTIKPILCCTYESTARILASHGNMINLVVIDEVQNTIPLPETTLIKPEDYKKYEAYNRIIMTAKKSGATTVLMTGSMNKGTVDELAEFFDSSYGTNFSKNKIFAFNTPGDEAKNRGDVIVAPIESMKHRDSKLKIIQNIVNSKQKNSAMILFGMRMSSTQGIFPLLTDVIPKLPPRDPKSLFSDANITMSDFEKDPHNKPMTFDRLNSIEDPDTNFVSQNRMNPLPVKGVRRNPAKTDIEELLYFNLQGVEGHDGKESDGGNLLRRADPNNLLYQSVLRGIGFIVGGMAQSQKVVIQKLFRSGKIYLLLATDSVGIGANLTVKHLYIPSTIKPPHFTKIDTSSLVQLVNRAGRKADMPGTIYVPLEDYEHTKMMFDSNPAESVGRVSAIPMGSFKKARVYMGLSRLSHIAWQIFSK
jgi:hypothetical protein